MTQASREVELARAWGNVRSVVGANPAAERPLTFAYGSVSGGQDDGVVVLTDMALYMRFFETGDEYGARVVLGTRVPVNRLTNLYVTMRVNESLHTIIQWDRPVTSWESWDGEGRDDGLIRDLAMLALKLPQAADFLPELVRRCGLVGSPHSDADPLLGRWSRREEGGR